MDGKEVLELVKLFADTWFSLDAYDKELLSPKKVSKKKVQLTAEELFESLTVLKRELMKRGEATDNFAQTRTAQSLEGIVGNVMQWPHKTLLFTCEIFIKRKGYLSNL